MLLDYGNAFAGYADRRYYNGLFNKELALILAFDIGGIDRMLQKPRFRDLVQMQKKT